MWTWTRLVLLGLITSTVVWHAAPLAAQTRPGMVLEPQSPEAAIVNSATDVLAEIMTIPALGIPRSLLANAEGIAIVPGMIKGGFIVGIRHGRGVVVARDQAGGWQLPQFITLTGGSVGWQAGVQATDLILVFKTKKSIQGIMNGKFTIGGDASAAAGPVGRDAAVATDATLKAEIYSYSRSRGLFAGVALDGTALQIDGGASAQYYRPVDLNPNAGQAVQAPASAVRLLEEIAKYTAAPVGEAGVPVETTEARPAADALAVQRQLGEASRRLSAMVDDRWKGYLALPAEVYGGDRPASAEALAQVAARFQAVATNPQYAALAQRPEFQETFQLLQQVITLRGEAFTLAAAATAVTSRAHTSAAATALQARAR